MSVQPYATVLSAQVISIGGDTDTLASITAQIAGAVVGSEGLPWDRIADIDGSDEILAIAQDFAEFVDKLSAQS